MARASLLLLLLLLLLLRVGCAVDNYDDDDYNDNLKEALDDGARAQLAQLRSALVEELQRRQLQPKSDGGLADVYRGAKAVGEAVDRAAKKRKRKKKEEDDDDDRDDESLWSRMKKVLPTPVWILLLCLLLLLLASLLLLLLVLAHRRWRRDVGKDRRHCPPPYPIIGNIDIAGRNKSPFGSISYSIEYEMERSALIATVTNCFDLPRGLDNIDPYVVIRLDSDKGTNEASKVAKNTTNPVFNYSRTFKIKKSELKNKVIHFEIYDWDYGTKHTMLARKVVHLKKLGDRLDEILGKPVFFKKELKKGLEPVARGAGEICIGLTYSPTKKQLSVLIVECKGVFLQKNDSNADMETLPNTFVEVKVRLADGRKLTTKRSELIRQSRNPYFNMQCACGVEPERLEAVSVSISLVHKTATLGIKRTVGFLTLSADAEKDSIVYIHWREMLRLCGRSVARWHSLTSPQEAQLQADIRRRQDEQRLQEELEDKDALLVAK